MTTDGQGFRDDQGKLPWSLAAWDAFREVVKVGGFGAKKYAPRNWERGMLYSRVYDSMMRHCTAWFMGEDKDPETGLPHMAHAAWNALALCAYQIRGMGRVLVRNPDTGDMVPADDRPHFGTVEDPPNTKQGDTMPSAANPGSPVIVLPPMNYKVDVEE